MPSEDNELCVARPVGTYLASTPLSDSPRTMNLRPGVRPLIIGWN